MQADREPNSIATSPIEGDIVCLVPVGDATLSVYSPVDRAEKRFSVSTSVLRLASRFFDRLFYGPMAEAQTLRGGSPKSVRLDGDDACAIEIILRILHHHPQDISTAMDLETIANVAMHCDKYDISNVLEPWVSQWLDAIHPIKVSSINLGLLLLTTQRVRSSTRFSSASALAIRELASGFEHSWSAHELLQHIPDKTICKTTEIKTKLLATLTCHSDPVKTDPGDESKVQRSHRTCRDVASGRPRHARNEVHGV